MLDINLFQSIKWIKLLEYEKEIIGIRVYDTEIGLYDVGRDTINQYIPIDFIAKKIENSLLSVGVVQLRPVVGRGGLYSESEIKTGKYISQLSDLKGTAFLGFLSLVRAVPQDWCGVISFSSTVGLQGIIKQRAVPIYLAGRRDMGSIIMTACLTKRGILFKVGGFSKDLYFISNLGEDAYNSLESTDNGFRCDGVSYRVALLFELDMVACLMRN